MSKTLYKFQVSIDCHSADMGANIVTSVRFDGKIYAKGSPLSCVEDIENSLNFNITFGYNDIECGVEREGPGVYSNEVVIQHHGMKFLIPNSWAYKELLNPDKFKYSEKTTKIWKKSPSGHNNHRSFSFSQNLSNVKNFNF